jgi:twitching motility protein PilJ
MNSRFGALRHYALLIAAFFALLLALFSVYWYQRENRPVAPVKSDSSTQPVVKQLRQHLLSLEKGQGHALLAMDAPQISLDALSQPSEAVAAWEQASKLLATSGASVSAIREYQQSWQQFQEQVAALVESYEQANTRLAVVAAPVTQQAAYHQQLARLAKLQATVSRLRFTEEGLNKQLATLKENHTFLQKGGDGNGVRDSEADTLMEKARGLLEGLAGSLIGLSKASDAGIQVVKVKDNLEKYLKPVEQANASPASNEGYLGAAALAPYGLVIITFLLLIGYALQEYKLSQTRIKQQEDKDARQQQAILSLLDEITNLANGDLTVDVTVTEDFTGAIADSINYTVQTLRGLVGTINSTSGDITASIEGTQGIAQMMSEASDRQAREITHIAASITASSHSLQAVSTKANTLAREAQLSLKTANAGNQTVMRTVTNMTTLRDQIQETAKRIKRLGESSQEIGTIIEFINDIAEQTNTLALNASIQAAMAGDAGRGFAVVADEVQRLAERAADATRQVENLVKAIQADTQEAITSMEKSTANVVFGARSAEEAGLALGQIEKSSDDIAKLIQEISQSAQTESEKAIKLAGAMQTIRQISIQTLGSVEKTATAVTELGSLSNKLRESVAGFKLPSMGEEGYSDNDSMNAMSFIG